MQTVAEKTDKEILNTAQRFGEGISIVVMLLLPAFFAYHQIANTGFFTAKFGALEMLCMYGPMFVSLTAPAVRALYGRRNTARPFEIAANVFMAIAALWLLTVFPFNFAHLADALPVAIRFILSWVTNDIGKVFLILQLIIGVIVAFFTTWQYLSHRRREFASLY